MNPILRPLLETIIDGNTDERATALHELLELLGVDIEYDSHEFYIHSVLEGNNGRFKVLIGYEK